MFDEIIRVKYCNKTEIEYGYIYGIKNTSLLIVVGQNGSINGYENKYVNMAHYFNKAYGVTVVVAANPFDGSDMLGTAMTIIRDAQMKYVSKADAHPAASTPMAYLNPWEFQMEEGYWRNMHGNIQS